MNKKLLLLLVFAAASFSVYLFSKPLPAPEPPLPTVSLLSSGLAWQDGNLSRAFFVLNSASQVSVNVSVFEGRLPERVVLLDYSDQSLFKAFSSELEARFTSWGVPFSRVSAGQLEGMREPSVLVIASSAIPEKMLSSGLFGRLLDGGWVVAYSGLPFSYVRGGSGIVPNTLWEAQKRQLGFDFAYSDAFSGYSLSQSNGSAFTRGQWQVFGKGGTFAAYPRSLDQSWTFAGAAADAFSSFILNASWAVPVVASGADFSGVRTVFSPPFAPSNATAVLLLRSGNFTRRILVGLRPGGVRALNPERAWANQTIAISLFSDNPVPSSVRLSFLHDAAVVKAVEFAQLPAGVGWVSRPVVLDVPEGEYLLGFSGGDWAAHSFIRVLSPNVTITAADLASKNVYASVAVAGRPLPFAAISLGNLTLRSDGDGMLRFKDAFLREGPNKYRFSVEGVAVEAEYAARAPLLASYSDWLFVAASVALFGFAYLFRNRFYNTVRLLPPPPVPARQVVLSADELQSIFSFVNSQFGWSRVPLRMQELRSGVSAFLRDPYSEVLQDSLQLALEDARRKKLVYLKGGLAMPCAWFSSEKEAEKAFFRREASDLAVKAGWAVRWKGDRLHLRRGKDALDFSVGFGRLFVVRSGRRLKRSGGGLGLDEFGALLSR